MLPRRRQPPVEQAVSKNSKKTESCKKMKKPEDKNTDNFKAWSPRAMESTKEARAAKVRAPTITSSKLCRRENEAEKQGTSEKPNSQFMSIPRENVKILDLELNKSLSVADSHPPSDLVSPRDEDVEPSQAISDFKNFRIIVDGTDITSEIKPEPMRISYFNLCRAHNSLLHGGFVEGISLNHAVFVISQTIDISRAIKTSDISTPQKEIIYWSKALESFSTIGMDVGFMLARVNRLLDLKIKETNAVDRKQDEEAKTEEERIEEKIRALESEMEKMREEKRRIQEEREVIRKKANEFDTVFRLEASAPW